MTAGEKLVVGIAGGMASTAIAIGSFYAGEHSPAWLAAAVPLLLVFAIGAILAIKLTEPR